MSVPHSVKCREKIMSKDDSRTSQKEKPFKVVSYNILADCHLSRWDYSYTKVDPMYHEITYRHGNLMKELAALDGDIICLQEVEPKYFSDTLEPEMNSLGYSGVFVKRKTDYFDEGCATFYRKSAFSLLDNKSYYLGDKAAEVFSKLSFDESLQKDIHQRYIDRVDVLLIVQLKSVSTGQSITIANTHLTWDDCRLTDTRALQCRCAKQIIADYLAGSPSACVLCGDFNSVPDSLAYSIALGEPIPDDLESVLIPATNKPQLLPVLKSMLDSMPPDNLPMKSSYKVVMGREPSMTNTDGDNVMTLDYIFYTSNHDNSNNVPSPLSVLDVPPLSTWTKTLPPDQEFASDHLSLMAEFY